jgi:hypothetical protein
MFAPLDITAWEAPISVLQDAPASSVMPPLLNLGELVDLWCLYASPHPGSIPELSGQYVALTSRPSKSSQSHRCWWVMMGDCQHSFVSLVFLPSFLAHNHARSWSPQRDLKDSSAAWCSCFLRLHRRDGFLYHDMLIQVLHLLLVILIR